MGFMSWLKSKAGRREREEKGKASAGGILSGAWSSTVAGARLAVERIARARTAGASRRRRKTKASGKARRVRRQVEDRRRGKKAGKLRLHR